MFNKNSRYFGLDTVIGKDRQGRKVTAIKLRRLPETNGDPSVVTDETQLDVTSERKYRDATRFWKIADANSDLEANELVQTTGRTIKIPKR